MRNQGATWTGVVWLAFASLTTVAACGEVDEDIALLEAANYSSRDSAGVRIVESPGTALDIPLPLVVETVPDLELGGAASDTVAQFHRISGIVGLPDGGMVVLDGGSRQLRWFDASGAHVRTVGRRGQGPGEFGNPLLIPQFRADSLLVFERTRSVFTLVAMDGSGVRTLDRAQLLQVGTPLIAHGSRALFRSASSPASCQDNQPCELSLLLRWTDLNGSTTDTLATHTRRMLRFTQSGPPVLLDGPFDQGNAVAAGPEGPVIEGDPRFELRQFDGDGQLRAIFRVDAPPRGTPQEALKRFARQSPNPDELRRIYAMMGLPEVLPAFRTLRVDPLGWYWAELYPVGDDDASEWLVFDSEGRARGTVELPRGLEVHDIGEDYVLGRRIDELGVEYVRRHSLDRRRANYP
jgi:hypothetical protein